MVLEMPDIETDGIGNIKHASNFTCSGALVLPYVMHNANDPRD